MKITKEKLLKNEYSMNHEWLVTNGIGGFASSTLCGLNTRKYHALLVAAIGDSRERRVILSKVNESAEIEGKTYSISTNECPNYLEDGYVRQECFEKEWLPEWTYNVHNSVINKKFALLHKKNAVCILYNIKTGDEKLTFYITPLLNNRDFHKVNSNLAFSQSYAENAVRLELGNGIKAYMNCDGRYIEYGDTLYENMYYRNEADRGLEALENHYIPGTYEVEVAPNSEKEISFILALDEIIDKENVKDYIRREEIRLEKICKIAGARTEAEKELAIAADNFVIDKNGGKTIIAGYPWFSDWGRDTFIAFEGIVLRTNRFLDAKNILNNFIRYIKNGLIPNVISENGGESYNSVDSSLWYIEAFYQYIRYTNDFEFLKSNYNKLLEIIEAYKNGTDNNIYMDKDYLIVSGNEKTQLTWMDAKVGDVVPTPRYGKAVEINALWYNALKIMEYFSRILKTEFDRELSLKVRMSFDKFFNENGLYDTIEPCSAQIRPNQIIAAGLSYPVVSGEKARNILDVVTEKLYTDKGLKTLESNDSEYVPRYEGDVYKRDTSYHQGTVWPWLYKPYAKAYREVKKEKFEIKNIEELLSDDCIGNVAEIYDAEEPRTPKGAFAQAWSVAAAIETL